MEQVFTLSMTACPFSEQRSQHTTDIPLLRARGAPPPPAFSAETLSLKPEQQLHGRESAQQSINEHMEGFPPPAFNKILSYRWLLTYWCLTPERFTARHNPLTGCMQICRDGPTRLQNRHIFGSVNLFILVVGVGVKEALGEGIVGIRGL